MSRVSSFLLSIPLLVACHLSVASDGFFSVKLGSVAAPAVGYDKSTIGKIGIGRQFKYLSAELNYFYIPQVSIKNVDDTYVKISGGEVNVQAHYDANWTLIFIGAGSTYYKSEFYFSDSILKDETGNSLSIHAGLLLPIAYDLSMSVRWEKYLDISGVDFNHYTLGIRKLF